MEYDLMSSTPITPNDTAMTHTRITNPTTLTLARVTWVVFVAIMITLNVLNIPQVFNRPICQSSETGCEDSMNRITQGTVDGLAFVGIDYHTYVTIESIFLVIDYAVILLIAGFLFWQRSNDRMALILAAALVCYGGF